MSARTFPDGFIWGTATAAHQVEGGNANNDWWVWEHATGTPVKEPSGDACDHFWRYPDDIKMLADLGFGAYRFSVEWSRIEPEEGEFSRNALDHYRRMCATCHENGVLPIVTYHHFTSPRWLTATGGWAEPGVVDRFARFAERTAAALGDVTAYACTFNEPNWVAVNGYFFGIWPPGEHDLDRGKLAGEHLCAAHRRTVEILRAGPGNAPIGMTLSMTDFQAVDGGESRRDELRRGMEDQYLDACEGDDFIGVQTYTRIRVNEHGPLPSEEGVRTTLMGYEFWPEALGACIRRANEYTGLPVLVTENGIGTDNDDERIEYVERALGTVLDCLDDGLDVRAYCYWSLLDNFEWVYGYGPTFGLVAVDRDTQTRTVKPSAQWLGAIAKANALA